MINSTSTDVIFAEQQNGNKALGLLLNKCYTQPPPCIDINKSKIT